MDEVDRLGTHARGEHPVEHRRRAAALHVTEDRHTRLDTQSFLDGLRERRADATSR